MSSKDLNLLFYSHKCPYSIKCLQILEPYSSKINFIGYINIHKSYETLPEHITQVPTLVLKNGEIKYEGYDVYLWVCGLVQMLQTQDGPKTNTSRPEIQTQAAPSLSVQNNNNNNIETMWSSSSLLSGNSSINMFAAAQDNKTITESIDYSRIKMIDTEQDKITVSPDALQEQRKSEMDKFFAKV